MALSNLFFEFSNKLRDIKTGYSGDIWHYTSANGLKGILEDDCIWFSDRRFLNDSTECSYVYALIKELEINGELKKYNSDFVNLIMDIVNDIYNQNDDSKDGDMISILNCYVASFSMSKDNLGLWSYYTKNQEHLGYSFKIDVKDLLKKMIDEKKIKKLLITNGKVIYSKKIQINLLKDTIYEYSKLFEKVPKEKRDHFIDAFLFYEFVNLLELYNIFFKPKCYESENEYRFVITSFSLHQNNFLKKKVRIYKEMFIPYVELKGVKNLIKEIMVSPALNQNLLKNSVTILKDNYGLKDTIVSKSKIPLRY